jgi:phosphoglycolate phosphatase
MNKNNHFRAIVFDVDGTLFDTLPSLTGAATQVLQARGLQPVAPAQLKGSLNEGLLSMFSAALGLNVAQSRAEEVQVFQQECMRVYCDEWLARATLFAGAADCLGQGREEGLILAICTNRDKASTQMLLKMASLEQLIGVVVGMGDALRPKPAPDPLITVLDQLSIAPEQALFVGDSSMDAACAQSAGVRFAAHLRGYAVEPSDLLPQATRFADFTAFAQWVIESIQVSQEVPNA